MYMYGTAVQYTHNFQNLFVGCKWNKVKMPGDARSSQDPMPFKPAFQAGFNSPTVLHLHMGFLFHSCKTASRSYKLLVAVKKCNH